MRLCLVALLALVQEAPVSVVVRMKDGNTVVGTTETRAFTLETSLGKLTLSMKDVLSVRPEGSEAVVTTGDGSSYRGKISQEAWKVKASVGELTLKHGDIAQISVQGVRRPVTPVPAQPPEVGAPARPPQPPPNPGIVPARLIRLGVSVPATARSADAGKLYVLNASDSKLLIVALPAFEVEKEVALSGGPTRLSLAPSGKSVVAAGKHVLSVISVPQGGITKSFSIEKEVSDLCALDDATVVVGHQHSEFLFVSIPKQGVTSSLRGTAGKLLLSPDGRRIHTATGTVFLPDKALGREEAAYSNAYRGAGYNDLLAMSPDGRYAVSSQGVVYRLGKSHVADIVEIAQVGRHWCVAWASKKNRAYVITSRGQVKEFDTQSWEAVRSWALGFSMTDAYVDDAGTILYGVGQAATGTSDTQRYFGQPVPAGDLLKFEIPK